MLKLERFHIRFKQLIKENFKSQKEAAKALNMTEATISLIVNGNRFPDTKTLVRIANYFGVGVDYFLKE